MTVFFTDPLLAVAPVEGFPGYMRLSGRTPNTDTKFDVYPGFLCRVAKFSVDVDIGRNRTANVEATWTNNLWRLFINFFDPVIIEINGLHVQRNDESNEIYNSAGEVLWNMHLGAIVYGFDPRNGNPIHHYDQFISTCESFDQNIQGDLPLKSQLSRFATDFVRQHDAAVPVPNGGRGNGGRGNGGRGNRGRGNRGRGNGRGGIAQVANFEEQSEGASIVTNDGSLYTIDDGPKKTGVMVDHDGIIRCVMVNGDQQVLFTQKKDGTLCMQFNVSGEVLDVPNHLNGLIKPVFDKIKHVDNNLQNDEVKTVVQGLSNNVERVFSALPKVGHGFSQPQQVSSAALREELQGYVTQTALGEGGGASPTSVEQQNLAGENTLPGDRDTMLAGLTDAALQGAMGSGVVTPPGAQERAGG